VTQTTTRATTSTGTQSVNFPLPSGIPEHHLEGTATDHNAGYSRRLASGGLLSEIQVLLLDSRYRRSSQRPDCVAGQRELRNVVANYPFERSQRFPGIQSNFDHRDCTRNLVSREFGAETGSQLPIRSLWSLTQPAWNERWRRARPCKVDRSPNSAPRRIIEVRCSWFQWRS
jgi:hypothetical protein